MNKEQLLKKLVPIDFEFNGTSEPRLNLVSCALDSRFLGHVSTWLHRDQQAKDDLKQNLLTLRGYGDVLLSFNVDAEAKSLISLGLNPTKFKWIDVQAEWKMLINHNDELRHGKQFIKGSFKTTYRKKLDKPNDKRPHDKTPTNLLAVCYKLLNWDKEKATEEFNTKNAIRKRIIRGGPFSASEKEAILSYGAGDIDDLVELLKVMFTHYEELIHDYNEEEMIQEMLWRGESVARAALMSAVGYPVSREKIVNFTRNIPDLIKECHEDINSQFPDRPPFRWNKKENRYSVDTKNVKAYIEESPYVSVWDKTAKGQLSLSIDAFKRHYHYRHDFPRDNFGAQFLRWLSLNQSLNGFRPKSVTAKNRETFFDYYGKDDRAHPYLNSYGAQSSRYQPKATGYLHLKAAWLRSMVESKPGKSIVALDYSSQEFLVAAIMSQDQNMLEAYRSGDVYLYFAKLAGAVPWDGIRDDYEEERDLFKSTTLGISYQMGPAALARKLTEDTKKETTVETAMQLIDTFYRAYPSYARWIRNNEKAYKKDGYLKLPDGWYMFKDNDNSRSVGNMPIQGMGACILRKATQLSQDSGLCPIIVLHDALYIEIDDNDREAIEVFIENMKQAFSYYFKDPQEAYNLIRLDGNWWGPEVEEGKEEICGVEFKKQKVYVDKRSAAQYKQFSKYFEIKNKEASRFY